MQKELLVYFSDVFDVDPAALEKYRAFNVSLINDLPLFIDPFLLFNSTNPQYLELHADIIRYVEFLRDKSLNKEASEGMLQALFMFGEVKQNWLGFSKNGNSGSGLGMKFASALHNSLRTLFSTFGKETITEESHVEKLTLIGSGVGRDNISDFTTTLIKRFLLEYTQTFAQKYIDARLRKCFNVDRVSFSYETETWVSASFDLPALENDFVLLTPKDILTKDVTWINSSDLWHRFEGIVNAIPDDALRHQIDEYFRRRLSPESTFAEIQSAKVATIEEYPVVVEYYIKEKEERGDDAQSVSEERVRLTEQVYVEGLKRQLINVLFEQTSFYQTVGNTKDEARKRVEFLKDVIENKDGYTIFWHGHAPVRTENDIQILYGLTWCGTVSDINREENNGRGPVDFKVSRGSFDKTLVEFKLASNSQLKRNLEKQVEIYQKANNTDRALKVITYFVAEELEKVKRILRELKLEDCEDIILIDARKDNKPSGSKA
jgi:hypothetical protein